MQLSAGTDTVNIVFVRPELIRAFHEGLSAGSEFEVHNFGVAEAKCQTPHHGIDKIQDTSQFPSSSFAQAWLLRQQ